MSGGESTEQKASEPTIRADGQPSEGESVGTRRISRWEDRHWPIPKRLYHYTDASGLIGMLESNSIWATHARYLNDASELDYVREIAREVLGGEAFRFDDSSKTLVAETMLAERLFKSFEDVVEFYVACFCEDADLLSQWREYGTPGTGFAVGFDFTGTELNVRQNTPVPHVLRRVLYDRREQVELMTELLSPIADTIRAIDMSKAAIRGDEAVESIKNELNQQLASASRLMLEFACSFKHPSFAEENEWRFVSMRPRGMGSQSKFGLSPTRVRASDIGLTPFVEVREVMKTNLPDNRTIDCLPIREVVVGPSTEPELQVRAVQELCGAHLDSVLATVTSVSEIPLRV